MEVKTLRFIDKQSAMKEIRLQYGLDAVILDNKMVKERRGLFGLFSKKICEITIAYEPNEPPVRLGSAAKGTAKRGTKESFDAWLPKELDAQGMQDTKFVQSQKAPTPRPMPEDAYRFKDPIEPDLPLEAPRVAPPTVRNPAKDAQAKPAVQVMDGTGLLEIKQKREKERAERIAKIERNSIDLTDDAQSDVYDESEAYDLPLPPPIQIQPAQSMQAQERKSPKEVGAKDAVKEQLRQFASSEKIGRDAIKQLVGGGKQGENLESTVDEIKDMLQRFTDRLEYAKCSIESGYSPEVEALFAKLIANGVQGDIAHELSRQTQKTVDSIQAKPDKVMRKILSEWMGEPVCIKGERGVCKKIMLIGPTGVGKTTTLAKLAAQFAIKQHFNVGVINADIFRIAAQDQLNAYADIMNIPCITVFSTEDMVDALKQFADKDIVLIDTTGKVASDEQYHEQIRSFVTACEVDQVFLTLCSTTAERVLKEIIRQHSFVEAYGLIVTKIDEDVSLGNFVNIVKYSGHPLGYYTVGQNVPDDIRTVDTDELIDKILR